MTSSIKGEISSPSSDCSSCIYPGQAEVKSERCQGNGGVAEVAVGGVYKYVVVGCRHPDLLGAPNTEVDYSSQEAGDPDTVIVHQDEPLTLEVAISAAEDFGW